MARKLSPGTHTIRIKKRGGGTRMQRVNVLKSGKFKFIKNVKGGARAQKKAAAKPRGKARRTSPTRRRNPRMAKRKMRLGNRVANALLLLLTFSPAINIALTNIGNTPELVRRLQLAYTGIGRDGSFKLSRLAEGWAPVAVGFVLFEVKKMAMQKFRV